MLKNYFFNILDILKSKLVKSISIVFIANLIASFFGFISTLLSLRQLDTVSIAILYPTIGIMMIFAQFADLGITSAFIKNASIYYKTDPKEALPYFNITVRLKVSLALISMIVCILFSKQLSLYFLNDEKYFKLVQLIGIGTFFHVFSSFISANLQVMSKFKAFSLIKAIPPIFKTISLILLWYFDKFTLENVIIVTISVPILSVVLGLPYLSFKDFFKKIDYNKYFPKIYNVAKWVFISAITSSFLGQTDILMLSKMSGPLELEKLVAGLKLASPLPIFTIALTSTVLPKVSSMQTMKEVKFFVKKINLLIPLLLVGLLIIIPLSGYIIELLLGSRYINSISVFRIYIASFIVSIYITPLSTVIYRFNKEYLFTLLNIIQLIANVLINYFLIPIYGAPGAAFATFSVKFFAVFFMLFHIYRYMKNNKDITLA